LTAARDEFLFGDDLFGIEVAAAFGLYLAFDVETRDACTVVLIYRTRYHGGTTKSCVCINDGKNSWDRSR